MMRRFLLHVALLLAILVVPPLVARAAPLLILSNCPPGQVPVLAPQLADLREQLGAIMGEPLGCASDQRATGSVAQATTTGFAVYRDDTHVATFTNGREHWSLTPSGMAYGTGWHGSVGPLIAPIAGQVEEALQPTPPIGTYARAEAVAVVRDPAVGERLVVRHAGASFAIETEPLCAARWPSEGGVVFVVSPGAFAGSDSRLLIGPGPGSVECGITQSRSL
jgi:hypothetical protein